MGSYQLHRPNLNDGSGGSVEWVYSTELRFLDYRIVLLAAVHSKQAEEEASEDSFDAKHKACC